MAAWQTFYCSSCIPRAADLTIPTTFLLHFYHFSFQAHTLNFFTHWLSRSILILIFGFQFQKWWTLILLFNFLLPGNFSFCHSGYLAFPLPFISDYILLFVISADFLLVDFCKYFIESFSNCIILSANNNHIQGFFFPFILGINNV